MKGLDYSSSRPNLAAVKAAGYGFVVRYAATTQKGITRSEAVAIRNAGLGLALVFEAYAKRPLEGRLAGRTDALTARTVADAIGFPATRPIYFAVDWDARSAEQAVIDEYLRGAGEVLGAQRIGVYGSCGVVDRCYAAGSAKWFWQTYAWSGGKVSRHAHFRQYLNGQKVAGITADLNETYTYDFGAWDPPVPVLSTPSKPTKQPIHIMTPSEMLAWMKNLTKR